MEQTVFKMGYFLLQRCICWGTMTVFICHGLDSGSAISLKGLSLNFGKNIMESIGIIICF